MKDVTPIQKKFELRIVRPWLVSGYSLTDEEVRPGWRLIRFYYDQAHTMRAGVMIYKFVDSENVKIEVATHDEPSEWEVERFCYRYDNGEFEQ